jgi:hypothetical protein
MSQISQEKHARTADSYEVDFHAWTFEQARRLRAGEAIDAQNVAEELEDLGRSQQQQLVNRLAVLLAHMLKWEFQPKKRSQSWTASISEQRVRIRRLMAKMPSLRAHLAESIAEAYEIAVTFASAETKIVEEDFPQKCPYAPAEILPESASLNLPRKARKATQKARTHKGRTK